MLGISRLRTKQALFEKVLKKNSIENLFKQTYSTKQSLKTSKNVPPYSPLHNLHEKLGAKMVEFGDYYMPLVYPKIQSQIESHNWVRNNAGLFDVSHMVQHVIAGEYASEFLESLTPIDTSLLENHSGGLSLILNDQGGIIDDTIISRIEGSSFYMVTNAGCREKDSKILKDLATKYKSDKIKSRDFSYNVVSDRALVALQGPKSAQALQSLTDYDLSSLYFGENAEIYIHNIPNITVLVSRGGYTGEDGFEISIPVEIAESLSEMILNSLGGNVVKPAGLAARDTLRLEAGMCLYGHDINETTTPAQAGLSWTIPKSRRQISCNSSESHHKISFPGEKKIIQEISSKSAPNLRVGIIAKSGPPAREGAKVLDKNGSEQVGIITSGLYSPTLKKNISMGYVNRDHHKRGTEILLEVRGKRYPGEIVKTPFVPTKYYRKP